MDREHPPVKPFLDLSQQAMSDFKKSFRRLASTRESRRIAIEVGD